MRRSGKYPLTGIALVGLALSGCAAGPSIPPDYAVAGQAQGSPAEPTTSAPPPPPQAGVPQKEPRWRPCRTDPTAGLPPGPDGLVIECATITGPLDPATSQSDVGIDLTRARTAATPEDAAPLVLMAGSGQSSRSALAGLATGTGGPVVDARPVVAVDRRGTGPSTDPACFADTDAADLTAAGRGGDPVARAQSMMDTVNRVTVSCTDVLRPAVDAFDAVHAASDIDTLRNYWGVDKIDLLTLGDASDAAMAYQANLPGHLARVAMDSPGPFRVDAATTAERRAQSGQAAFARFVSDCTATDCAAGPDPARTLDTLVASAQMGLIRGVSDGSVLTVVRQTLADAALPWDRRVARLGDLIGGAAGGDVDTLRVFADAQAITSGGFVARCSDAPPPATPDQSHTAQTDWADKYPVFGADAAVRMLTCSSWPSHQEPDPPEGFDVPVLLFSGAADTVVGAGAVDSVSAAIARTGSPASTVTWEGVGHGALWGSGCAVDQLSRYLADASIPPGGTACPV
ncbi:alpha/beta hydrolase [Tomitella fengzijianii]|uniref:Alpha/beta hydrolase n=1 Tax=Tomitella fengzijianii TaxID=2597660 RepID=A0A516X3D7_9ACTN|nr:alpha/beta hydrolase [Tomitella fengzijianii]QDQ97586.1 alpha/beta hydrolase [Tomitella fengzijianii]